MGHSECVYLPLPVKPQRGELCNPLSFHRGPPLSPSVGVLRRRIITPLRRGWRLIDICHLVISAKLEPSQGYWAVHSFAS